MSEVPQMELRVSHLYVYLFSHYQGTLVLLM